MTLHDIEVVLAFALLGAFAGATHFTLLRRYVNALTREQAGIWQIGSSIPRFLITSVIFLFAARLGGIAIIATLAAFLLARAFILRAERRSVP